MIANASLRRLGERFGGAGACRLATTAHGTDAHQPIRLYSLPSGDLSKEWESFSGESYVQDFALLSKPIEGTTVNLAAW